MASSQASGVNTPPYVDFKRAVELMLDGHPVIFPTETFFALGSRALDADATARVYRAKHRSTVRPLPLILGDWEQLDMIAKVHDELFRSSSRHASASRTSSPGARDAWPCACPPTP